MTTSHIYMTHKYGETPANVFSDFDWIRLHENELLEQYGECSVIVYQQHVLGVGATYDDALKNAEHNLPPDSGDVTPVHEWICDRKSFSAFFIKQAMHDKKLHETLQEFAQHFER
jgi:hypothetical protein